MADWDDRPRKVREVEELFPLWDLDGSNYVEWPELQQVLESCERLNSTTGGKRERKLVARLKGKLSQQGTLRPLSREEFTEFMVALLRNLPNEEWAETMEFLRKSIDETRSITTTDRKKRVQWSLFQLLDINQDGIVEFSELQAILTDQSKQAAGQSYAKKTAKTLAKWEATLQQRKNEVSSLRTMSTDNLTKGISNLGRDPTAASAIAALEEPELQLTLAQFHSFMDEVFKDYSDDDYVEAVSHIQTQLSLKNNETAHREYLKRENIPDLINDMVSFVLQQKKDDPLDSIIEYLEKHQQ